MKPFFLRITHDTTSADEKQSTWHKSIYILGIKIAEWKYFKKTNGNNKVGFKKEF